MTWEEKEYYFERQYQAGTHCKNPDRYIPERLYKDGAIQDFFVDSDGYWIWLENGWTAYDGGEDCGVIHDYLISDFKDSIKTIRKK